MRMVHFCLKILKDILKTHCATYLMKVDLSASLACEFYTPAQIIAKTLMNISTPLSDRFLESCILILMEIVLKM